MPTDRSNKRQDKGESTLHSEDEFDKKIKNLDPRLQKLLKTYEEVFGALPPPGSWCTPPLRIVRPCSIVLKKVCTTGPCHRTSPTAYSRFFQVLPCDPHCPSSYQSFHAL